MASNGNSAGGGFAPILTRDDEMGLAEAKAAQNFDSVPDTLEVHSDSVAVMQDSVRGMRRPALLAAAAVGAVIVGIVVLGILGRAGRGETQPPLA